MAKETIKISLTEFMNFVNKSGSAKATVVSQAKHRREEDYAHWKDYWLPLRNKIKDVHKKKGNHDDLKKVIKEVAKDKKDNYTLSVDGYCSFWKKRKIEWVEPPKKTWAEGDIRIELNPELGLVIKDKIYIIKLFTAANSSIDKRHADLILHLMEKELRSKVGGDEAIFGVLDVKRGKLFENKTHEISLFPLLKAEAKSFESLWKDTE
jgi:hypothetical protein